MEERPEDILEGASVSETESEGGDAADDANFGFSPDVVARYHQGYQHNEAVAHKAMRATAVSVLPYWIILRPLAFSAMHAICVSCSLGSTSNWSGCRSGGSRSMA